ncbi:MAG: hypothetical protein CM15mV5_2200 [uncultured marine virus]|nr:MAG: hypothetical protein CM15mV5_2200 [uncultured marine virus]
MPNIIDFKSKLNGGVRPNLYQVDIDFPARAMSLRSLNLNGKDKILYVDLLFTYTFTRTYRSSIPWKIS